MTQSTNVLCVLQDDYRKDYESELSRLRQTGANFVFESNPEKSLTMVGEIDPKLVIVGTEVGTMEGIEFLAMLTSQYPAFGGSVVVLPEKADGMPPVIHSRSMSTGRSAVEGVDFEQIASLIAGPAPEPIVEPAPQAAPQTEPATEPEPPSTRPNRPKWFVPAAAAVGMLVLIVVGYFIFAGGGEAKPNPEEDPGPRVASAVPEANPAKEPVKEPVEEPVKEAEKEPVEEPDPPIEPPVEEQADLPEKFVLPLTFEAGVGRPQISDRGRFDGIVSALKEQPGLKIELVGHTSAPGEVRNNFKLGLLRARMTKTLLVRRGISPRRVTVKSRGEREPIDSGGSSSDNRRVEVRIIR